MDPFPKGFFVSGHRRTLSQTSSKVKMLINCSSCSPFSSKSTVPSRRSAVGPFFHDVTGPCSVHVTPFSARRATSFVSTMVTPIRSPQKDSSRDSGAVAINDADYVSFARFHAVDTTDILAAAANGFPQGSAEEDPASDF